MLHLFSYVLYNPLIFLCQAWSLRLVTCSSLELEAWSLWLAVGLTRLYPNAILLRITSKTNWTTRPVRLSGISTPSHWSQVHCSSNSELTPEFNGPGISCRATQHSQLQLLLIAAPVITTDPRSICICIKEAASMDQGSVLAVRVFGLWSNLLYTTTRSCPTKLETS